MGKNGLLVLLTISSLLKSFGNVQHFSIDSLPGLSAVDLDSNKTINLMGRAQQKHQYDAGSSEYNPGFNADFAFTFGSLDPECGGQVFLTYFQSYRVPDINEIDTLHLEKMPRIDSIVKGDGFGPYYEINNFYNQNYGGSHNVDPDFPLNKYYLIKTNKKQFALLRINSYIYGPFDPSLLCNHIIAIKLEWWVQNDGSYDKLTQIANVCYNKCIGINSKRLTHTDSRNVFNLSGRKCLYQYSSGISIIRNYKKNDDKNYSRINFYNYQK